MGGYEQLHWQLSYVVIFHIASNSRVIRNVENGQFCTAAFVAVTCHHVHIANDGRVIRDVAHEHLCAASFALLICPVAMTTIPVCDVEHGEHVNKALFVHMFHNASDRDANRILDNTDVGTACVQTCSARTFSTPHMTTMLHVRYTDSHCYK